MKLSKKEKRAKTQSICLGMEKLEYECRNWSPKADRILRDMYLAGYDYSDIALRLNRTETAIHGRIHQLGLLNIGENNARKRQARQERIPSCLCGKCDLRDLCTRESGSCIYPHRRKGRWRFFRKSWSGVNDNPFWYNTDTLR